MARRCRWRRTEGNMKVSNGSDIALDYSFIRIEAMTVRTWIRRVERE